MAYGIDTAHTGAQTEPGFAPPLEKRWERTLGSAVSYPLIANGLVYVTVMPDWLPYGPNLWALDLKTGATVWGPLWLANGAKRATAAYDAGRVFTHTGGATSLVRALDAVTGVQLWEADLSPFVGGPPTARGGRVFVTAGPKIFVFDGATGQTLWTASTGSSMYGAPIVTDSAVYLITSYNDVRAFEPATGAVIWHYYPMPSTGGGVTGVLFGGKVYAPEDSPGLVLDAATGTKLDTFVVESSDKARLPAFHGDRGYFVTATALEARDLETWSIDWVFPVPWQEKISTPLVVNDLVYTVSSTGILYALSENGGGVVWSTDTGGPFTPPQVNESGHVHGLAAAEGALVVPAGGRVMAYW